MIKFAVERIDGKIPNDDDSGIDAKEYSFNINLLSPSETAKKQPKRPC